MNGYLAAIGKISLFLMDIWIYVKSSTALALRAFNDIAYIKAIIISRNFSELFQGLIFLNVFELHNFFWFSKDSYRMQD